MGQGEEVKIRSDPAVEIQERGEIFFFYRPKVEKEEAHGPDEVQKLYLVLRPESGEKPVEEKQDSHSGKEGAKRGDDLDGKGTGKAEQSDKGGGHGVEEVNVEKQPLLRFMVMGKKSLPDPSKRSTPYWGFVELVTTRPEDVKTALEGEEYDTATRGHRHRPPARAMGEGVYRILRHVKGRNKHTHLIYKLEFPPEDERNEAQEALNVEREGSFIIQIKNPDQHGKSSFRGLQSKRKAAFPAHLQGELGKKRFHSADPPDFLNYEGCEFLLIAASDDIEEELGLELKTEAEDAHDTSCSDLVKTFGETASIRPLLTVPAAKAEGNSSIPTPDSSLRYSRLALAYSIGPLPSLLAAIRQTAIVQRPATIALAQLSAAHRPATIATPLGLGPRPTDQDHP